MKKILFAWPPLKDPKGYATSGNQRQFSWLNSPNFAYPIIPALALTMLQETGNQTLWMDSVAEEYDYVQFGQILLQAAPDYIVMECPTPLIKRYWEIAAGIKEYLPNIKIILCGPHVTALPEESAGKVDHIVKGGSWHKEVYRIIHGQEWPEDKLIPHINRDSSKWWLYAYHNGNFRCVPGTYIMSAIDCWHRPGCTFCSWADFHPTYNVRPVADVLDEIEALINKGFTEIFDDSGTFPVGDWLEEFCQGMIDRGYNDYIDFGCNMRFGALKDTDFQLMRKAGFRMVLWGVESVNQRTLDLLNKGVKVNQIQRDLILARAARLDSHLTVMFGFPWETYEESERTYKMARYWLKKGYAFSAQATICIPYPGTLLYEMCKKEGILLSEDWDDFDQSRPIMKIQFSEKKLRALQKGIYNIAYHPEFLIRKLSHIRSMNDLKYYLRISRKIVNRFNDFYVTGKAAQD